MIDIVNLNTDTRRLRLEWEDIEKGVEIIHSRLPYKPDVVLALARGGVIPASLIARRWPRIDFRVLKVRSYKGFFRGKLFMSLFPWKELKGKKILVVDDIHDSGATLAKVESKLLSMKGTSVHSAVIIAKRRLHISTQAFWCDENTWVTFPWERGEKL